MTVIHNSQRGRSKLGVLLLGASLTVAFARPLWAATLKCPIDSVKAGNVCVDKYEASLWQIPVTNSGLIRKVQAGKATLMDLTDGGRCS